MKMTRREFSVAAAMAAFGGCAWRGSVAQSRRKLFDYWCTWETQVSYRDRAVREGKTGVRSSDFMNEELLFGKNGWANLYPGARDRLVLLLDAGWDQRYRTNRMANGGRGIADLGAMVPDSERFPSLKGSATEKLRQLRKRVEEEYGWGGLGIWVAPQKLGEWEGNKFSKDELVEDMKRKLAESQEAGVAFWKVDIGVHQGDIWYCQKMSELADVYAPDVIIDHSCAFANGVNGVAHPHIYTKDVEGPAKLCGKTGRMIGVPGFEPWGPEDVPAGTTPLMSVRELYTGLIKGADSFRSYDTVYPMDAASSMERAVFQIQCADSLNDACIINVEDNPLIGAALGTGIGVMRSAMNEEYPLEPPQPRKRRLTEITRTVRWHEDAPPFGSDRGTPVAISKEEAEETWKFGKDSTWWDSVFGMTLFQRCAAVTARGIALPEVRHEGAKRPIVAASRNPETGAISVASIPIVAVESGRFTPKAKVSLEGTLKPGVALGVFGELDEVELRDGTGGKRIMARDVAGGEARDISGQCRRSGGRIAIPGKLLAEIGREMNPSGDPSSPGVKVTVV